MAARQGLVPGRGYFPPFPFLGAMHALYGVNWRSYYVRVCLASCNGTKRRIPLSSMGSMFEVGGVSGQGDGPLEVLHPSTGAVRVIAVHDSIPCRRIVTGAGL